MCLCVRVAWVCRVLRWIQGTKSGKNFDYRARSAKTNQKMYNTERLSVSRDNIWGNICVF